MDQSVSDSFRDGSERKYLCCDTCGSLLPAPGYYCVQCEPPQGPESKVEGELTFRQAMLRISFLILLFVIAVVFKLDINRAKFLSYSSQKETKLKIAEDEDFKIFFKINADLVNVRSLPNVKTSKILASLPMGTQVEVLNTEKSWSKVKFNLQSGDQAETGWIASKLLDSEIK